MKFKISDLLKNIQAIKSENYKEILALKKKLNEKIEEINDLKNLNNTLKKQLEKVTNKVTDLNNQISTLKSQNKENTLNSINTIYKNNNSVINYENDSNNHKINNDESMNTNNLLISDYYSKNTKNSLQQSDINMNNKNRKYRNEMLKNDVMDMSIYKQKDPTLVLLNKSLNYKNKNKSNDRLNNVYRNNRYNINRSKYNSMRLKIERFEQSICLKSTSSTKGAEALRKTQNDFSLKAYNNLFKKYAKNKEKRVLSAKILNIKDFSNFKIKNKASFDKTFYKLKLN